MPTLLRFWPKTSRAHWATGLGLSIASIVVSWIALGPLGAAGMTLGLVGSASNLLGWRWMIGLGAKAVADEATPKRVTFLILLWFFIKLPFFVVLGLYANWLGGAALPCFLAGLGLVYSALAGWVLVQSQGP